MNHREAYERSFFTLLDDSTELGKIADIFPDSDYLARACATTCLLLIETAANCCIDALGLESKTYEEIDRLPVSAKFDLFLRIRFRRSLDRSRHEYAQFRELRKLRDSVVHPKSDRVLWEVISPDEEQLPPQSTPILGVGKRFQDWQVDDAKAIMRAVHGFLAYYFSEQCRLKPAFVSAIVFSDERVPNTKKGYFYPGLSEENDEFYRKWQVKVDYFRWS